MFQRALKINQGQLIFNLLSANSIRFVVSVGTYISSPEGSFGRPFLMPGRHSLAQSYTLARRTVVDSMHDADGRMMRLRFPLLPSRSEYGLCLDELFLKHSRVMGIIQDYFSYLG